MSGPYIITTKRPGLAPLDPETAARDAIALYREACDDGRSAVEAEAIAMREVSDAVLATHEVPECVVSRHAVATLEEAQDATKDWLWTNRDGVTAAELARAETWDGTSVLTLDPIPNGTAIEAEEVEWRELVHQAGLDPAIYPANVALDVTYTAVQRDSAQVEIIAAFNAKHGGER
jgi:hypothetical protein